MIDIGHFPRLIGARLRELRATRGLTATGVARLMGSHHSVVCRLENGHHTPGLESIARYARACGYDVHDVLSCLKPSPSAAESAPFAASGGISGTSQPGRSHPPALAATGHLTLDAPFGRADVRALSDEFIAKLSEHAARADVQTPGAVVGAASVCSDSPSLGVQHGPPVPEAGAVALPTWSPCS